MIGINTRRAVFVYEAARLAAIAAGAPIIPEQWPERDPKFQANMEAVVAQQCGQDRKSNSEELHNDWVRAYEAMGWVYGPERDVRLKTHPDMVSYDELGQLERDKDDVFVALCEIARQWIR